MFQTCPLVIGSFGYSAEDVVFKWKQPKAVAIDKLGLAQFHLVDYESYEGFENVNRRTRGGMRNDSTATLKFNFERQTGFFLLQIYTPLTLIGKVRQQLEITKKSSARWRSLTFN